MKQKKILIIIFAVLALIGIGNCVLLEPAIAFQTHASLSSSDFGDGCLICQQFNHQWAVPEYSVKVEVGTPFQIASSKPPTIQVDPSVETIFHPPHTL